MWKFHLILFFMSLCAVSAQTEGESTGQLDSLLNTPINSVSKAWQNIRVAPASVTIVTDRDIRRFGYRTLAEVMNAARGFYTGYDRNYSYIGVRGFSRPTDYNNRLLVLLNGHYLNENVYGSAGFGTDLPLNFDAIERIEIVRGPGSAVYGTGAMFAIINIITKSGQQLDGLSASAEIGSLDYRHGQIAAGGVMANGMEWSLAGVAGKSEGGDLYFAEYDTDSTDGIARKLDGEQYYSVSGRVGYDALTVQGYYSFRQKDIPTAAFDMAFNYPGPETHDVYGVVEARYEKSLADDISILLRANYNYYDYDGLYYYPEENSDSSTNKWFGGEAQIRWDITDANRLIAGVEYKNNLRVDYRSRYDSEMIFSRDEPFTVVSSYLQDELQVYHNFNFTAGLRMDYNSATGGAVSPRLGLIYNPYDRTTLKLLYGAAFRSPNFSELYLMFPGESKENPGLKSEKISTLELMGEQQIGSDIYTVVSVYYNRISRLIEQFIDPADSLLQFQNRESIGAMGAEFEINTRYKGLRTYASYALQSSVDERTDIHLSNSPVHLLKAGLCVDVLKPVSVALDAVYESPRRTVYNTETSSFVLAGLNLVWQPSAPLEFSLRVSNLLNTSYSLPGGFEHRQQSIDQNGRTITGRIRVAL